MRLTLKPLSQQVVVITGATSGIGLATALSAAAQGARVVVAARNADALADTCRRIEAAGGRATSVEADVSRHADVERIAEVAVNAFGGFDTWINNAGVSIFGHVEEISEADHRQLFETNFWSVVHGSMVATAHFRGPRHTREPATGGALINLGSEASDVALPLQTMYAASKHAVKGFTDGLRMELMHAQAPISVTLIKPAGIDTPFTQHARNYLENEPNLPAPVYTPDEVARAILHAATHPVRDLYVGGASRLAAGLNKVVPRVVDRFGANVLTRQQMRDTPARDREGSLDRPHGPAGEIRGDHPGHVMGSSLYTRAAMHPIITTALLAGAAIVAAAALTGGSGHADASNARDHGRWAG